MPSEGPSLTRGGICWGLRRRQRELPKTHYCASSGSLALFHTAARPARQRCGTPVARCGTVRACGPRQRQGPDGLGGVALRLQAAAISHRGTRLGRAGTA